MSVKRADWVTTRDGGRGFVMRVARDGAWADVRWRDPELGEWTKRMPTRSLIVRHTIPIGNGWTVTDMDREEELRLGPAEGARSEG